MSLWAQHLKDDGAITVLRFAASIAGQANITLLIGTVLSMLNLEPGNLQTLEAISLTK